ncbi:MAG TPA: c-type cytochrome [Planctomycetes bacterium]|nr:c-type cytochrome [Planctomycetota bacterium]
MSEQQQLDRPNQLVSHGEEAHSFDGIQEYDNKLPNWWLWTFYLACIFSVVYWIHYHVLQTGPSSMEAYQMEMKAAKEAAEKRAAKNPLTNRLLVKLSKNPKAVEEGKKLFLNKGCVACHKADAGGLIGPNLTDEYWIHGSKPVQIFQTISEGVPLKGMPAHKATVGRKGIEKIVAYLQTIRNTHVKGGKEPQGKKEDG